MKSVPEYVVLVKERVGGKDDAFPEGLFREVPTDEFSTGIRRRVMPGGA